MSQPRIVSIAIKRQSRQPLEEVESATVTPGEGLEGNVPTRDFRRITFISREQWEQVQQELGMDLPWHTRRANILVEGLDMADSIGKSFRVGEMQIKMEGETKPCGLMETYYTGLRDALKPECRGGIYGRVLEGGAISVGDTIEPIT